VRFPFSLSIRVLFYLVLSPSQQYPDGLFSYSACGRFRASDAARSHCRAPSVIVRGACMWHIRRDDLAQPVARAPRSRLTYNMRFDCRHRRLPPPLIYSSTTPRAMLPTAAKPRRASTPCRATPATATLLPACAILSPTPTRPTPRPYAPAHDAHYRLHAAQVSLPFYVARTLFFAAPRIGSISSEVRPPPLDTCLCRASRHH
jgi:hypothetical protein